MGMAVLLALVIGVVWIAVLIVQFIALLSLIALGLAVWAVIAVYAVSFLGLYFLLGEPHIGWALFGGALLGTLLLKLTVRRLKQHSNQQESRMPISP